jgi:arginyl-tRNA synthetase
MTLIVREQLTEAIQKALVSLGVEAPGFVVEHPAELSHGDYSTNVAMVIAGGEEKKGKREGKRELDNSRELSSRIAALLKEREIPKVEHIEIAGPGFINFHLSRKFFAEQVGEILQAGDAYGRNDSFKGQKVMVEYTDPNPFKIFHIGHLMSNAVGESISRLIEFSGAEIKRANYQGDVGMHVAGTVWTMREREQNQDFHDFLPKPPETASLQQKAEYLGSCYAISKGNIGLGEAVLGDAGGENIVKKIIQRRNEAVENGELEEVNKKIYERTDENINNLYDWGKKISLEHFESIYVIIGTHFDQYFFESEAAVPAVSLVNEHLDAIFEESNGAIVFHAEKYDPALHTRVFLNSQGIPTYEAKELALAKLKYDRFPYDTSVVITGNEINEYFKVVHTAMSLVYPELAEKTKHVSHGMLRLPSGKMSSRTGSVVTAEWLVHETKKKMMEKMRESDVPNKDIIAEQVAIAAIKYSILKQAPGKDIIFDFEKSLSFEGDSGPYLQYTAVRARSVLEKARTEGIATWEPRSQVGVPEGVTETERLLYRFPEVVLAAREEYAPQQVVHYLTALAGSFNTFYAQEKIADAADPRSPYKLALTEAVATVLKNGLWLLGIVVPEKM